MEKRNPTGMPNFKEINQPPISPNVSDSGFTSKIKYPYKCLKCGMCSSHRNPKHPDVCFDYPACDGWVIDIRDNSSDSERVVEELHKPDLEHTDDLIRLTARVEELQVQNKWFKKKNNDLNFEVMKTIPDMRERIEAIEKELLKIIKQLCGETASMPFNEIAKVVASQIKKLQSENARLRDRLEKIKRILEEKLYISPAIGAPPRKEQHLAFLVALMYKIRKVIEVDHIPASGKKVEKDVRVCDGEEELNLEGVVSPPAQFNEQTFVENKFLRRQLNRIREIHKREVSVFPQADISVLRSMQENDRVVKLNEIGEILKGLASRSPSTGEEKVHCWGCGALMDKGQTMFCESCSRKKGSADHKLAARVRELIKKDLLIIRGKFAWETSVLTESDLFPSKDSEPNNAGEDGKEDGHG